MGTLVDVCEVIMIICFGASWPFNIVKAYKAKSTKGTSLLFMSLIGFGYVCGILGKIFKWVNEGTLSWIPTVAFVFYIINFAMIVTGVCIYFRNKKLDKQRALAEKAE